MQQYYIPRELVKSNRTKSGSWSNYIVVLLTAGDFNHTDSKEISVKKKLKNKLTNGEDVIVFEHKKHGKKNMHYHATSLLTVAYSWLNKLFGLTMNRFYYKG